MAECECLPGCTFFNAHMTWMPTMSEIIRERYCRGSNADCARNMVYRHHGSAAVPLDLFPSQVERAEEILGMR